MALLAKDRRKEVEALIARLQMQTDRIAELENSISSDLVLLKRLRQAITDLGHDNASRQAELQSQLESERSSFVVEVDRLHADYRLVITRLEGANEVLQVQGTKYTNLTSGFQWHPDGSFEIEGKVYSVFTSLRSNPLANLRLAVPEGQEFP